MGNQIILPEGLRETFGVTSEDYEESSSSDDEEEDFIEFDLIPNDRIGWRSSLGDSHIVDLESGVQPIPKLTADGKLGRIYKELASSLPLGIPVYRRLLYFQMIQEELKMDDYDQIEEGDSVVGRWMDDNHIYADVLDYNSSSLDVNPVFMRIVCKDRVWLFVREECVEMCVDLFWEGFKRLEFSVHLEESDTIVPIEAPFVASPPRIDTSAANRRHTNEPVNVPNGKTEVVVARAAIFDTSRKKDE